eukprot:10024-Heterococcus_DN1.PRE.2
MPACAYIYDSNAGTNDSCVDRMRYSILRCVYVLYLYSNAGTATTITTAYAAATTTITTAITYKQLFRVDTVELQTRQVVAVGYALLNVFIDADAKQPQQSDTLVSYLKEGNWQIPLYKKPPPNMQSLTEGVC